MLLSAIHTILIPYVLRRNVLENRQRRISFSNRDTVAVFGRINSFNVFLIDGTRSISECGAVYRLVYKSVKVDDITELDLQAS